MRCEQHRTTSPVVKSSRICTASICCCLGGIVGEGLGARELNGRGGVGGA